MLSKEEFLAQAKQFHNFAYTHSRLCADYINQFWLELDGRFPNARVQLFGEQDAEGRHFIVSDMKDGWPPDES